MHAVTILAVLLAPLVVHGAMAADDARPKAAACVGALFCADQAADAAAKRWPGLSMHPLVGHVLFLTESVGASGSKTDLKTLHDMATLDRTIAHGRRPIVLLGEQHDNPEHHWLRSVLAPKMQEADKPVAWVFEQFNEGQQKAIDAFGAVAAKLPGGATLAAFKAQTDWAKSGWQSYDYDPLLQAALSAGVPIYAGDVTREAARNVAKSGGVALSDDEKHNLRLDIPFYTELENALETEIADAHCGMLSKSALPTMALAQRYRDAHLAATALEAASKTGAAVVFAGNGHVRSDRGAPWFVRRTSPDAAVLSIMLIEVESGKTDPYAYVPRDPEGKPAADIVIFTPPVPHDDPCAEMKRR